MQKLYLSIPIKMEIMKCTVDNGKPKAFLFFSSQSPSVANHRLLLTGERLSIVFLKLLANTSRCYLSAHCMYYSVHTRNF